MQPSSESPPGRIAPAPANGHLSSGDVFELAFWHAPAGLALVGLDGRVRAVNKTWCWITGVPAHRCQGDRIQAMYPVITLPPDQLDTWQFEISEPATDRHPKWIELAVSPVLDPDARTLHYVVQVSDITAEQTWRDRERQLLRDASHGPLTGLPKRAFLADHLQLAVARHERDPTHTAVIVIDLDGFKVINDTMGHHRGDQVLSAVADRLSAACRQGDVVARTGGDGFVAIGQPTSNSSDGLVLATRLRAAVPSSADDPLTSVTASIGVTRIHAHDTTMSVVDRADKACYAAKQRGGNRIVVADDLHSVPRLG